MQEDTLGFLIGDCSRLLRRRFDGRARALGVSCAQWQVLVALSRQARAEARDAMSAAGAAVVLDSLAPAARMVDAVRETLGLERIPQEDE